MIFSSNKYVSKMFIQAPPENILFDHIVIIAVNNRVQYSVSLSSLVLNQNKNNNIDKS